MERSSLILSKMVITIDGPAGSGKSTTALKLAGRLGLTYLDTGAMYRAVTLAVLKAGVNPADEHKVTEIAEKVDLKVKKRDGGPVIILDGEEAEPAVRSPEVSEAVSPVSRYKGVRRAMVRIQRSICAEGGIVAEGRDTGTTVFPYAQLKVFLIADIKTRAERRAAQMESMGIKSEIDEIRENISSRDRIDSSREHSPLSRPPGSMMVDTSNISIDEQVSIIEKAAREEAGRLAGLKVWRGERNPNAGMKPYYAVSHALVKAVLKAVFGLRIMGCENIDYRENYIVASNHISYADPLVTGCAVKRELWFMAKKELFRNGIFAWLIRKYHAIPVSRGEPDIRSLKAVIARLEEGYSVILFPEGTRSRTGEIMNIKPGLSFVAFMTGKSIVPIYIRGSNKLKECFLRRERLEVRIGPPIRIRPDQAAENRKAEYTVLASMVREEMKMLQDESEA